MIFKLEDQIEDKIDKNLSGFCDLFLDSGRNREKTGQTFYTLTEYELYPISISYSYSAVVGLLQLIVEKVLVR